MTTSSKAPRAVSATQLKAILSGTREFALIDTREEAIFADAHLLFAACLPLSQLELRVATMIPRRTTSVILCDDGAGSAEASAQKLHELGYADISLLEGGIAGWRAAGFKLFSGVNVPSKAFGEFIESTRHTPRLTAAELDAERKAHSDLIVIDCRPFDEYQMMSVPGAINCPGADLLYRFHEIVPRSETLVVVNCAGRTRSIVGAQSLINAGIPNRVFALKNGTMGWHLAGYPLEKGKNNRAPEPSAAALTRAKQSAKRIADRSGVRVIDQKHLGVLAADSQRTTYLLDVRSPEEFERGHLHDAISAPGGQLVQETDRFIATRNARLVLVDTDEVRAPMTGAWLRQMGWQEVYTLCLPRDATCMENSPAPTRVIGLGGLNTDWISSRDLARAMSQSSTVVVDLADSLTYRRGHIPGAWFAIRSDLRNAIGKLPQSELMVITSNGDDLARLAAADADGLTSVPVKVLSGGTQAWTAAGLPLERDVVNWASEPNDIWYRPYDHQSGAEESMRAYLKWELDLMDEVRRDGDVPFALIEPLED